MEYWTFCIAQRAKQNSPWASALGRRSRENRPERAAERRALFPKKTFVESDSMAFQKFRRAQSGGKGTRHRI
jgi:hypothetical protein